MREIVTISPLVASYATVWAEVAKTSSLAEVSIGDTLHLNGDGPGLEVLKVEAVADGRLLLQRQHPARYYPVGSVFRLEGVEPLVPLFSVNEPATSPSSEAHQGEDVVPTPEPEEELVAVAPRRRGRPVGSKNKPRQSVQVPVWPGVA